MREVVGLYETVRRESDPHVRLTVETEAVIVPGREGPLSQVFRNVIDNARSFSQAGGEVRVALSRERGQAMVRIDDDGPGIAPHLREEVFKPFLRLDDARNQDEGGTGLGLAIARDIARSHGGDIILSDSPLGGLRATVRVPV